MSDRVHRSDPFRLDGRMALVTGATGHLGRAVALALADGGATVLLAARHSARLEPLCQDLAARGARALPIPLDTAQPAAMRSFFEGFRAAGGRLDILVNTDIPVPGRGWQNVRSEDFVAAAAAAIARPFELVRAATPLLEAAATRKHQACVINIAAPLGANPPDFALLERHGLPSDPHSGPAQAGMLQLTRCLAVRLAPKGIRVTAVTPGAIPVPAIEAACPGFVEELKRLVPLGRLGSPGEVAGAVRFLASDAAAYVTGAVLPVDGGWSSR